MNKIKLSSETIDALNEFLDKNTLELNIETINDAMDEYLELHCENVDGEEAMRRLDMASGLRRISKDFQKLLNSMS